MTKRVVVTGMQGICPLGWDWKTVGEKIKRKESGVRYMPDWEDIDRLTSRIAAPVMDFQVPTHYTRKQIRTMGKVALLAVRSTELALENAGLLDSPKLKDGSIGVSYGSTNGSGIDSIQFMEQVGVNRTLENINGTLFIKFMSHTCAANISQFFQTKGRIIPSNSACTSGSQGVGFGYEAIKYGMQDAMICGGSEELHHISTAVFDVMFATSKRNDAPQSTPAPFDRDRDGLVVGEGASTLILESLESAEKRGATILAEVVGFATNADGAHMVNPSKSGMLSVMQRALDSAELSPDDIDYVNAHGTSTEIGDVAESNATYECFNRPIPISSFKSYIGHTLGACGAIEAWASINMLNEDWVMPTLNLDNVDPKCGPLDYVTEARQMPLTYVMSNNFAFGGVNTSLIFKKWS